MSRIGNNNNKQFDKPKKTEKQQLNVIQIYKHHFSYTPYIYYIQNIIAWKWYVFNNAFGKKLYSMSTPKKKKNRSPLLA